MRTCSYNDFRECIIHDVEDKREFRYFESMERYARALELDYLDQMIIE